MIPATSMDINEAETKKRTGAFGVDFENKKIGGIIDGKEALVQHIRFALLSQRYKYPVFSHSFGTDYKDIFNEGYEKAMGIVKNSICDSLSYDDRIYKVYNFRFEKIRHGMKVKFSIETVYGDVEYETEVK